MREDLQDLTTATTSRTSWPKHLKTAIGRLWPFALGIAAALIALLIYTSMFPEPAPLTEKEINETVVEAIALATPRPAYSAQVYEQIIPSIVLVQAQFDRGEAEENFGLGSGVVVNDAGDILTALHVVSEATEIEVTYADGTSVKVEISAAEPQNDIAVLHPSQPPGLIVPAILGNPFAMKIGDEAFAVGNPLGLTASMSAGVISGFNRSIPVGEDGEQRLERLIQFDTAVNPGNSGGPLLNRQGQVVGIVTALANPSEQNFFVGIGFAVPIGTAVAVAGGPGI
ncbi:MAG: S1C family serine protease [Candidatus Promineifilaceae bacterium]|jgi:S1-C subfamily serine protease